MMDLSKIKQEQYKIKLPDGKVLKLKKPTQSILITLYKMQEVEDTENIEILEKMYKFILRIFNRNLNDMEFTEDDIDEMFPVDTATDFLIDFFNFHYKKLGE